MLTIIKAFKEYPAVSPDDLIVSCFTPFGNCFGISANNVVLSFSLNPVSADTKSD